MRFTDHGTTPGAEERESSSETFASLSLNAGFHFAGQNPSSLPILPSHDAAAELLGLSRKAGRAGTASVCCGFPRFARFTRLQHTEMKIPGHLWGLSWPWR